MGQEYVEEQLLPLSTVPAGQVGGVEHTPFEMLVPAGQVAAAIMQEAPLRVPAAHVGDEAQISSILGPIGTEVGVVPAGQAGVDAQM